MRMIPDEMCMTCKQKDDFLRNYYHFCKNQPAIIHDPTFDTEADHPGQQS